MLYKLQKLLVPAILSLLAAPLHAEVIINSAFDFALVRHDQASLSPDGEYIAAITTIATQPEAHNLVTMRLADGQAQVITGFSDTDVESFFWANDKRIIFSTDIESETENDVRRYRGSYTINRDGTKGRKLHLTGRRNDRDGYGNATPPRLLHRLYTDWNNVLISRIERNGELPEVSLLDINTGRARKTDTGKTGIVRWIADNSGYVRAAIDRGGDVLSSQETVWYRDTPTSEWRELMSHQAGETRVLAFGADNRHLIALARVQADSTDNRQALYLINTDGKRVKGLVLDPVFDAGNLAGNAAGLKQTSQGHPVYYQYMADKLTTVYFDPRWEARQKIIDEALADTVNTITDWSDDERKLLVLARDENDVSDYYLYDTGRQELKVLAPPSDWVR